MAYIQSISYGKEKFSYQVSFSQRKSLSISVLPNQSICIKAPIGTSREAIHKKVELRVRWIKKQVQFFEQFDPRTPKRAFIVGESHLYLGKSYRLKLFSDKNSNERVRLNSGYFNVSTSCNEPSHIRELMTSWYKKQARHQLNKRFEQCWTKLHFKEFEKPTLKLIKLKKRWGSLSKAGTLSLNTDLIRASTDCIDYVITHELCHLAFHDHSNKFYGLLERTMPDWKKRKKKLELQLM